MMPAEATLHYEIGSCYRNLGELSKSEEYILMTLKIHPFHPQANYEMALTYFEMEKKNKALEHLKRTLSVWENADPEFKPVKQARDKIREWELKKE
jgi:tetratricopeptide (TPR) repeat protein